MAESQKKPQNPAKVFLKQYRDAIVYKRHLAMYDADGMLTGELDKAQKTIERVVRVITLVPNTHQRDLLMMRYVSGWSWPRCIMEMQNYGYAERSTYELHRRALQAVEKILTDSIE